MNTFRYIILWAAVALAAIAQAETLEQLKARMLLQGQPKNVIAVGEERGQRGTFMPGVSWVTGSPDIYYCRVIWVIDTGATVKRESKDVLFLNGGSTKSEEVIGWLGGDEPDFLKAVAETKYLSGRNTGGWAALTGAQQLAAITTKLNEYWVHAQGAARDPILRLVIEPINANTIKATGEFDTSTGWEQRTYYVTLTDPNGSLVAGNANVKFRRLAETVQAP